VPKIKIIHPVGITSFPLHMLMTKQL